MSRYKYHDSVIGGIMGLAVGDAFGVPVEFMSRKEVQDIHLDKMEGCDTGITFTSRWGDMIPAGTWSDDTSMTIAAVDSIVDNDGLIDWDDVMLRFFRWWMNGDYSAIECQAFGLGRCCARALHRYQNGFPALRCGGKDLKDNGNGSLMRIFPFSMYCIRNGYDDELTAEVIGDASGLTHGHDISKMGCFLYTLFLRECLETKDPKKAYATVCQRSDFRKYYGKWFSEEAVMAYEGIQHIDPEEIKENGYVVDSLKVALYSIVTTKDYESAVKRAVNFGYDTDTNAAITGSIAGALYGLRSIPGKWLSVLKRRKYLMGLAKEFARCI